MVKRLKNTSIVVKLMASFLLVIFVLAGMAGVFIFMQDALDNVIVFASAALILVTIMAIVFAYLVSTETWNLTLERESNMLGTMPFAVNMWDDTLTLIDCNQNTLDMFGIPDKKEYFKRFYDLSPKFQPCGLVSKDKFLSYIRKAMEEGWSNFEYLNKTVRGEHLPTEIFFVRIERSGKYMVIGYFVDLRPLKASIAKAFEAEEEGRAKTRFLALMSHEIRTPISVVLGISEIQLQSSVVSPDIEESFVKIYNSAKLLLGIVNDILDFSKLEDNKMIVLQEEYEMENVISYVTNLHHTYLGDKSITFALYVDENLPLLPIGDPLRIEQIVINLLSNAFKYTESGVVEICWLCYPIGDDSVMLEISVNDTGMGMTKEQLATIYDDYTRFHENTKSTIGGTGLGMSIVYRLVKLMGATIEIESELHKGTNITVRIPQKVSSTEIFGKDRALKLQKFEAQGTKSMFRITPEPMPYGSVLIVDDIEANLYVARGLLSFYDLNIETCDGGFEAIEKINQGKVYDIIFMDFMMPEINGMETMHTLRRMGYEKPIVVLTANALVGQGEEFMKRGFDDFLSKPIMTKNLNDVLIKYIKDKQPPEVIENAMKSRKAREVQKDIDSFQSDNSLLDKLRWDFAKDHRNIFVDMTNALNADDYDTAHRLIHTLKGLASLIHEPELSKVSAHVETLIEKGMAPSIDDFAAIESELRRVFASISKPEDIQGIARLFNKDMKNKALALFEKLRPMLEHRKGECLNYIEALEEIPETAILANQIRKLQFAAALTSLNTLVSILED